MSELSDLWGVAPHARVGIMGGSFNPAHDGHLHIARLALERIGLDRVVWLISPQNPLKLGEDMAAFTDRFNAAVVTAQSDPAIIVSDMEAELGTRYTADTLQQLKAEAPDMYLVWIMGADNLIQIDKWEAWTAIFGTVPVAVFARPPYCDSVMACEAAETFAESQLDQSRGAELPVQPPPAWIYFDTPLNAESATRIRRGREAQ